MRQHKEAEQIIGTLKRGNFCAECPCCEEPITLKNAGLFYLADFTPDAEKLYAQKLTELKERAATLKSERKSISQRSESGARAVNIGFILERLAPSMKAFRFDRNDCRSLFDPIDYLIFEGLSEKGRVSKIIFADIKTGGARLQGSQKEIKAIVENKKIEWDVYRNKEGEI